MSMNSRDRQRRRNALMRQYNRCYYCDVLLIHWQNAPGAPPTDYMLNTNGYLVGYATLDHIVPIACGGSDSAANTVLACACCNERKGHMSADEFLAILWG